MKILTVVVTPREYQLLTFLLVQELSQYPSAILALPVTGPAGMPGSLALHLAKWRNLPEWANWILLFCQYFLISSAKFRGSQAGQTSPPRWP